MKRKNKYKRGELTNSQKIRITKFIASIDLFNHFTTWCGLDGDVDYSDLIELESESLMMNHDGKILYIVPCLIYENKYDDDEENYVYGVRAYYYDQGSYSLPISEYTPTWKEIADALEEQQYPCGWVTDYEIEEVIRHLPPELLRK